MKKKSKELELMISEIIQYLTRNINQGRRKIPQIPTKWHIQLILKNIWKTLYCFKIQYI